MTSSRIEIPGLADLRRDLKDLPKDTQKALPREMEKVAEIVARDAARRVPSKSGTAINSIRAKGVPSGASIVAGGSEAPYFPWLDFGSREPRSGNSRAEGPWRGSGAGPSGGRFIYPAIEAKWDEVIEAAGEAVERAAREAGFR